MIKTIIITSEEAASSNDGYKSIFQEKSYKWIEEEFDKGWLIEMLSISFYNKELDRHQYCDILYRAWRDNIHLELLERLKIGL
jgi:hypothetical protein